MLTPARSAFVPAVHRPHRFVVHQLAPELPDSSHTLQASSSLAIVPGLLQSMRPFDGLLLSLGFRHSIPLLDAPNQLIFLAGDRFPVTVGEFTPALAGRAGELLPFTFDLIPIHVVSFFKQFRPRFWASIAIFALRVYPTPEGFEARRPPLRIRCCRVG